MKTDGGSNAPFLYADEGYNFNVFIRHYHSLSNKFYLFGEGQAFFLTNRSTQKQNTDGKVIYAVNGKTLGLGVSPGVSYVVSKRIHLESQLPNIISLSSYRNSTENFQSSLVQESESKGVSVNVNVSPNNPFQFTFRFVLGK